MDRNSNNNNICLGIKISLKSAHHPQPLHLLEEVNISCSFFDMFTFNKKYTYLDYNCYIILI